MYRGVHSVCAGGAGATANVNQENGAWLDNVIDNEGSDAWVMDGDEQQVVDVPVNFIFLVYILRSIYIL